MDNFPIPTFFPYCVPFLLTYNKVYLSAIVLKYFGLSELKRLSNVLKVICGHVVADFWLSTKYFLTLITAHITKL